MSTQTPHFVTANSLSGKLALSYPGINLDTVKKNIADWLSKQDRFWPEELTNEALSQNLQLAHVAHWVLLGEANSQWSASIGTDHTKITICSTCSGRGRAATVFNMMEDNAKCTTCDGGGRVEKTERIWTNQSGFASVTLEGNVFENVADDTPIRCGKREFSAESEILGESIPQDILVLVPENTDNNTGIAKATEQLEKRLEMDADSQASALGYVRNLRLANKRISNVEAYTWLYPMYIGTYSFKEQPYLIEIDAITSEMFIEVPLSIKAKRTLKWIAILAVILGVGYGIVMLGVYLHWW